MPTTKTETPKGLNDWINLINLNNDNKYIIQWLLKDIESELGKHSEPSPLESEALNKVAILVLSYAQIWFAKKENPQDVITTFKLIMENLTNKTVITNDPTCSKFKKIFSSAQNLPHHSFKFASLIPAIKLLAQLALLEKIDFSNQEYLKTIKPFMSIRLHGIFLKDKDSPVATFHDTVCDNFGAFGPDIPKATEYVQREIDKILNKALLHNYSRFNLTIVKSLIEKPVVPETKPKIEKKHSFRIS